MFFQQAHGIIALDIDGTVTSEAYEVDSRVIKALEHWTKLGWKLIFITGRPFQWGSATLSTLPCPYSLAVQNGALLLDMPSGNILIRKYLFKDILPRIENLSNEFQIPYIIYSGLENEDKCYYLSESQSAHEMTYGLKRALFLGEKWESVNEISELPVNQFSSIKFFSKESQAFPLSYRLEKELGVHAPPNRDPYNPDYFVIQATHSEANKGSVLQQYAQLINNPGPVIAAGDDHNDLSMLKFAHIKVVMSNAPLELLEIADIIAPPASQLGIIQGLEEAIEHFNSLRRNHHE